MNRAHDPNLPDPLVTHGQFFAERGESGGDDEQPNFDVGKRFIESLKRRWWYYGLITVIAAGAAYFVADEYGSYVYTAYAQVESKKIPIPPGRSTFYSPPGIDEFPRFLHHPQVANALRDQKFSIRANPSGGGRTLDDSYDRKTGVVTVKVTRDTREDAAELVNLAVKEAIELSSREREETLQAALEQFNQMVTSSQNTAQNLRLMRANRVQQLKEEQPFQEQRRREEQYNELTATIQRLTADIDNMARTIISAQKRQEVLLAEQEQIVGAAKDGVIEQLREAILESGKQYAKNSSQAKDIAARLEKIGELAAGEIKTLDELNELLDQLSKTAKATVSIPAQYAGDLSRIADDLYDIRYEMLTLPDALKTAEEERKARLEARGKLRFLEPLDIENHPDIYELDAQIAYAETEAARIKESVQWAENMLKITSDCYKQTYKATAKSAQPDGNHKKLAVGVFGAVGLLLGMPILLFDVLRSQTSPSEKLGKELGLSTLATRELVGKSLAGVRLEATDPELRLLALRIQQSARHARGSVVMFSSLADSVTTDELTTTIGLCLAARQEKVLILNLEPIAEHRQGRFAAESQKKLEAPAAKGRGGKKKAAVEDVPAEDIATELDLPLESESGNRVLANGGKVGLAAALSGATNNPEEVLVHHGSDGIDRLELGEGELPVEAFAAPLMTQLLDTYRNEYSMVLLSGPAAKHLADVQMLAGRCDGTLFVAPSRGALAPTAKRTIISLMEDRNPIMGIAEIPV